MSTAISCYTEQSVLVCEETESNGHVHDESCYTSVQSELICEITDEDHKHGDDCYAWENVLTCEGWKGDGATSTARLAMKRKPC